MADEIAYEILDGVRRAKAAALCGNETINARINGIGPAITVSIDQLRSPKDEIETFGVRGLSWGKVLRATQNSVALPPIEITPGTRGVAIADVIVEDIFDALERT